MRRSSAIHATLLVGVLGEGFRAYNVDDLSTFVRRSDVVVLGRVTDEDEIDGPAPDAPTSRVVTIRVDEWLKGEGPSDTITFMDTGWTRGDHVPVRTSGVPRLGPGDRAIVGLGPRWRDGTGRNLLGAFPIVDGRAVDPVPGEEGAGSAYAEVEGQTEADLATEVRRLAAAG